MKVVGIAEPLEARRSAFQKRYEIDDQNVFTDWKEVSQVTAQKMKFSTDDFFSKCDQIRRNL